MNYWCEILETGIMGKINNCYQMGSWFLEKSLLYFKIQKDGLVISSKQLLLIKDAAYIEFPLSVRALAILLIIPLSNESNIAFSCFPSCSRKVKNGKSLLVSIKPSFIHS